ncbi:MAG: hypothetical protein AB1567_11935 [bacterium]
MKVCKDKKGFFIKEITKEKVSLGSLIEERRIWIEQKNRQQKELQENIDEANRKIQELTDLIEQIEKLLAEETEEIKPIEMEIKDGNTKEAIDL